MRNILLGLIVAASLYACDKEDGPENALPGRNYFEVSEDATDEESVLRREFAGRNGVYLLFNDTLGYEEVTALSGEKVRRYETLHLGYNMLAGSQTDTFKFCYYSTLQEKKAIAEFVEEEVLENIPALFRPYSVLLVKDMVQVDEYGDTYDLAVFTGMKAMAIASGRILELTPDEKTTLKNTLIQEMIIRKISAIPETEFSVFYSYSEAYYNITKSEVPTPVQNVGFLLNYFYDYWKEFNTKEYDRLAYVEEVFKLSESQLRETYAQYPMVIRKMEELIKVLHKYGVNIYK